MKIIKQVGILFGICWISLAVEAVLPIPLPASVTGLVLLLLCLASGLIKIHHIQEKADFLLGNMAFFFVPAGVSIIRYFDVLRSAAIPIGVICLVTTVLTFGATAWSVQLTVRLMKKRERKQSGK